MFRLQLSCYKTLVVVALVCLSVTPVLAEKYYDAGIKSFQAKKYQEAAQYFEESIKDAPWESNTFYYCALAYHYMGDKKKAAEKYGECVERFPGTAACNSALAALKVVDPDYMKRKATAFAAASAAAKAQATAAGGGKSEDKGTIEGQNQTRVLYRQNGADKVIDIRINGRNTRAIFDQNGESTAMSRQQLASLAINPEKGATQFRCDVTIGGITRKNFPVTVDDSGSPARIGNSFLDAFNVNITDSAKMIDMTRRAAGAGAAEAIAFSREGKDILISAQVNGRGVQLIFDPDSAGLSMTSAQAKSAGLKVDEAETEYHPPGEGPQRGEEGWKTPDEKAAAAVKNMSLRLKLGPVEKPNVNCKIVPDQSGVKHAKLGGDFLTGNGYKFDLDFKSSKIILTRK